MSLLQIAYLYLFMNSMPPFLLTSSNYQHIIETLSIEKSHVLFFDLSCRLMAQEILLKKRCKSFSVVTDVSIQHTSTAVHLIKTPQKTIVIEIIVHPQLETGSGLLGLVKFMHSIIIKLRGFSTNIVIIIS